MKPLAEGVIEDKYAAAQASLHDLLKSEADRVSSHVGSLIQAMAQFTGESNGVLSTLLQSADTNGFLGAHTQLAGALGNHGSSSTQ